MTRSVFWTSHAWDDYLFWQSQDKKVLKRVNMLVRNCQRVPFDGLGKPEPMTGSLSGYWSRRIDDTHRLVYDASDTQMRIIQCQYRYR